MPDGSVPSHRQSEKWTETWLPQTGGIMGPKDEVELSFR